MAVEVERQLREKMGGSGVFEGLTEENSASAEELRVEKDGNAAVHELRREKDALTTQCEMLRTESKHAKEELGRQQKVSTDHTVAMALLESKMEASEAKQETAESQVAAAEAGKGEAVTETEAQVTGEMVRELAKWKAKHSAV